MSFCVSMPHFTNIGSLVAEIWRLIVSIVSRWRSLCAILLPHRTGWRHFQKVNAYQHAKYRQDNSIHSRDITISALQKQTSAIVKYFFWFWLWPHDRSPHSFCIMLPNFINIGPPSAEIWRHTDFSRWRPRRLNTTSAFLLVDAAVFITSKSISKPNFVDIRQFVAEI